MRKALAAAGILLLLQTLAASAQEAETGVVSEPARAGVLVTLTEDGRLVLTPTGTVELENGLILEQDSAGTWAVGGTRIHLRELTANPFVYDGRRVTVTGGYVANVLPDYGFFQYSNLADGGTITVLTQTLTDAQLAPYAAGCDGFVTDTIPVCSVAITGTVAVNEADSTVELSDPVIITR